LGVIPWCHTMSLKVPRLGKNRHGVFYVRAIFFAQNGQRHLKQHSLLTKDPQEARTLALKFNLDIEERRMNIKNFSNPLRLYPDGSIEADLTKPEELAFMEKHTRKTKASMEAQREAMREQERAWAREALPTPPKPQQKGMTFSESTEGYLKEKQTDNTANTINEKRRTYKDFIATYGDLDINLITKPEIVAWKTADLNRSLGANRINKRLGQVNDFFKWAINHGHYTASDKSPADGLFISNKSKLAKQTENREPFTDDDLKAIYGDGYTARMFAPDHYWIPLVCLFSGARREEVSDLLAENVKTVDGVPTFFIEQGKTKDARRYVPIHQALISLGFLTYCEAIKAAGHTHLFPHRSKGAGGRGKEAGRMFTERLRKDCGIDTPRKTFHSTRHTFITQLHRLSVNPAHAMQLVGHSSESVHFGVYTHSIALRDLEASLNRITYPLNYDFLKRTDPTFSAYFVTPEGKTADAKSAARNALNAKHLEAKARREEWNKLKTRRVPKASILQG
jgi:integrase